MWDILRVCDALEPKSSWPAERRRANRSAGQSCKLDLQTMAFHAIVFPRLASDWVSNGITTSQALAFDLCEHLLARCRFALCALGGNGVGVLQGLLLHGGSMPDHRASSSKTSRCPCESYGLRT